MGHCPGLPTLASPNTPATPYLWTTGLNFVKMVKKNGFPSEATLPSIPGIKNLHCV